MPNVHDFTVKTIEGKEKKLADYKGRALLIVNVASECGYTPQYAGLEKLHEQYGPKGLSVLGFPCNDFGGQEPGTEQEIMTFCTTNYGVKFDMFSKVKVKGEGMSPLFDYLQTHEKHGGSIKWNFGKFLVDKDGNVVARFEHKVAPESPELRAAIEKALG
jgi:glutathione peroxidase